MFVGHFGAAFAAKRLAPRTSLAALFVAAQLVDLVWPALLLAGVERVRIDPSLPGLTPLAFEHYPITHSLAGTLLWSLLLAGGYFLATRYRRGALVVALLVVSHWLLDALVHRPDLLLWPGSSTAIGLGLWERPWLAVSFELAIFGAGVAIYLLATRGAVARWRVGLLAGFLLLIQAGNLLGPPPPSPQAIAWVGFAQWLLVLAACAVEHRRRSATAV